MASSRVSPGGLFEAREGLLDRTTQWLGSGFAGSSPFPATKHLLLNGNGGNGSALSSGVDSDLILLITEDLLQGFDGESGSVALLA